MKEDVAALPGMGVNPSASTALRGLLSDKRLVIVILTIAVIAIQFWAGSRVPALNEKALMGGDTQLAALGFDNVFPVSEGDPLYLKVGKETVNWVKTNQRGMTFGVVFAATLMLLLTLVKNRSFRNPYANSLMGMVIGAPLGVCVNCAAPIAKGLYAGGARIETTVAAMISSPTLNVIVLTILVSLFPLYLVAIKLGLTVAFIVLFIPLLTRMLGKGVEFDPAGGAGCPIDFNAYATAEGNETWASAVVWVAKNWLASFWNVVKTTVPLMFLAGFLGSLLILILPWNSMADLVPSGSALLVLLNMSVLAIVGIFLPVPIAFDAIIVAILLAAGMPVHYAMVLLFTLGIYSIYSFFVVWREISKPMAAGLWIVLAGFGVVAGVLANTYYKWDTGNKREMFYATFGESAELKGPNVLTVGEWTVGNDPADFTITMREPLRVTGTFDANISVERDTFAAPVGNEAAPFTLMMGKEIGIDQPYSYSVVQSLLSLTRFRGVASGDIHNDGWPDLLLTSDRGLSLYANQGNGTFSRQRIDAAELAGKPVVDAALVDLNSDGWLDIVLATYREGNYVIYNEDGRFSAAAMAVMPNQDGAILTGAMGFGDIDADGDLDAVFGNFGLGSIGIMLNEGRAMLLSSSRDALLVNEGGSFTVRDIGEGAGDTMSALLSDFNGDGALDLASGNDFDPSDLFFFGDGTGNFKPITRNDRIIPHTGSTTMNIVTSDIDNDLVPEMFVAQISGRAGRVQMDLLEVGPEVCAELAGTEYQETCERILMVQADIMAMRRTNDTSVCETIDPEFREDCLASAVLLSAMRWERDEQLCDIFPAQWDTFAKTCHDNFGHRIELSQAMQDRSIPQRAGGNVLLFRTADGRFEDRAEAMGLTVGGWSWNARFADLDNDEWQDIYIVNGDYLSSTREPNFFYRNEGGNRFVDATSEYGLDSQLATSGYTYVDMDNDGDLDIVSIPEVGPVHVYRNNLQSSNAIAIELEDHIGNRSGIGSTITIHYGPSGARHQMREIQASGGFVSFDAPVAHFGLGEFDAVDRIELRWSTGERSVLEGPFEARARYRIKRGY